ncbi:MAG: hypothetical protein AD742_03985 [Methylibium sp. NZG]|nr:MAG: hypothetical protein AD742_03985 [Methylibium sp. NZG]
MSSRDPWSDAVAITAAWVRAHGVNRRDVVVLLPFAQLLPVARRAFGASGAWLPRIETTQSLARSLGPDEMPVAGQVSFDVALDRIVASRLLRAQRWAAAWPRSDERGFEQAVAALVNTAHALARSAFAVPPALRAQHWDDARALLSLQGLAAGMPGSRERLLARVGLEWAAAAAAPATDALFNLQAAGWVALQAGGPDRLTQALLQHHAAQAPCLWLNADADPADPFATLTPTVRVQIAVCDDFESEAQRTAACVLRHLQDGEQPVALIAQDRALVRRVRALLGRQRVALRDETGWKLSTTRAGASVRTPLTCARGDALTDDWLDWLKACAHPELTPHETRRALDALERELRRRKLRLARHVDPEALGPAAARLWRQAADLLQPLVGLGTAPGPVWLATLEACLIATGQLAALEADDAGRQALAALRWSPDADPPVAVSAEDHLDIDAFSTWLDAALEQASFLPDSSPEPEVIVTPIARAMLRPFAAVVVPGVDERHLGAVAAPGDLLSDRERAALGVPDTQVRREADLLAFAQLLRHPRLTLLHRTTDDGEPMAASAWVELLRLALSRHADPNAWGIAPDPRTPLSVPATPVAPPLPTAPLLLPSQLSASACEALRACPYRFFARQLLRLGALEELDSEMEKREYGTWLHAVLQRFHDERAEPMEAALESARLHAIGRELRQDQGLDEAEFLPYASSFARLVPRYLDWLHKRDAAGATWLEAERDLVAQPPAWAPVRMQGRIDRVDCVQDKGVPTTQLIDYKTSKKQALRDAIGRGEDTQLPFYVALMAAQSDAGGDIDAMYLMLDESDKIVHVPHPDVQRSAQALVEGVGRDLARIAEGASLPALGEGRVCETCDARGLCRRDHWAPTAAPAAPAAPTAAAAVPS